MFDAKQLLSQYLGGQQASSGEKTFNSGNLGGLAGGALAGGLTGLLAGTRTGRKIGKNALIYGLPYHLPTRPFCPPPINSRQNSGVPWCAQ